MMKIQITLIICNTVPTARAWGQILSPWREGDVVDSGIGLSYRSASLSSLTGRYDKPMLESTISPLSGIKNLASVFLNGLESITVHKIMVRLTSDGTVFSCGKKSIDANFYCMSHLAYKDVP